MENTLKLKRPRVQISFEGELSRTKQSFKDECDINQIVPKIQSGEIINHVNAHAGQYADLTSYGNSYHENLNAILSAQNAFMALPSDVRKRFHNDPGELLDFVNDDSNYNEALKLGIVEAKPVAPIQTASDVVEAPSPLSKAISDTPSGASS